MSSVWDECISDDFPLLSFQVFIPFLFGGAAVLLHKLPGCSLIGLLDLLKFPLRRQLCLQSRKRKVSFLPINRCLPKARHDGDDTFSVQASEHQFIWLLYQFRTAYLLTIWEKNLISYHRTKENHMTNTNFKESYQSNHEPELQRQTIEKF